MPDLDRLSLGGEDADSLIAQMIRDVVAGLDPADPGYPDVVGGTFLHDLFGAVSLALDRAYDRVNTEMPRTALPHLTYGEWLDAWAELLALSDGTGGVGRKDAVKATGAVEFVISVNAPGPVTIGAGVQVSTEAASETDEETVFVTLAELTLAPGATGSVGVEALLTGAESNVPANVITVLQSGTAGVASIRNPLPTGNGAGVEDDEALQRRIVTKLQGAGGPGNVADYVGWGLEEPGVGFVVVQRNYPTRGGVRMILTDATNDPVGQPVIDRVQNRLDPVDGSPGDAPIGAAVTVTTAANRNVPVTGVIDPAPGYTLDGAGGTRPLRAEVDKAIRRYVERLPAGSDVIRHKVISAIVSVTGVDDVNLTVPAGDVAIAELEVPSIAVGSITLT